MKNYALLLVIGVLFSCSSNDDSSPDTNNDLIGDWKLIEIYADPGDGSGDFEPVDSQKTITFSQDGTITSTGSLCTMEIEATMPTIGSYSLTESYYSSDDCNNPEYKYQFTQTGDILVVDYPCIEPCQAKFKKQ